ncbi:MAG: ABC transporter permease [Patescibacteria group bacterium]
MSAVGTRTFIKRELVRSLRVPWQTFATPVITTFLFFVVFGFSIGKNGVTIGGLSYAEFIMPGLIMMNTLMSSFMSVSSGLVLAKITRTLSDILVTPLSHLEIVLGFSIAALIRGLMIAGLIYLLALLFVPFRAEHPLYLLTLLAMVTFAFSLFGLVVGIWAENFEQVTIVPAFFITPLSFLGGIFYSIHTLPVFLQWLSRFNPLLYMINGLRYGFYGVSDVSPLTAYLVSLGLLLALILATWQMIRTGYKIKN